MTVLPELDPAMEGREARLVHTLYSGLAREFVIDAPPCNELEFADDSPAPHSLNTFRQWFLETDQLVQVHQLRQFLQNSPLVTNDGLQALLRLHLSKPSPGATDRDKIDFLLVQFFSSCAPARLEDSQLTLAYVADILRPVLGTVDLTHPDWLEALEELIDTAITSPTMSDLLTDGVLGKGRALKLSAAESDSRPVVLVAFTRFNFLLRRAFFRLMHQDLNEILDGLRQLELQGTTILDCRKAEFAGDEPIARLRMICQSWKVMFQAEYSTGQPLRMLVELRSVVDGVLGHGSGETGEAPRARAAAASSGSGAAPE
jgi:hypothetical protein